MPQEFYSKLEKLLKKNPRFIDQEGDLLKNNVIDAAYKADKKLVELLLSEKEFRSKFFGKIKDVLVFNINDFVEYIQDKNFLADSYTKYRNKIGLNIDGKFLNERKEVSLVWPFKDCVLEGGMTKEDEKRKEIFFNEILAQDEIDKLFAPKVLTNWKRYTAKSITSSKASAVKEEKVKKLKRDENGMIKENLIIKGNNLLALYSLKQQFQNEIKLIYIDPPYYFHENKSEDTFGYNSNFKLSTWLVFMKNRIEIAKELLSNDGAIFIQIDDDGLSYLKVLLDEVFGIDNCITTIAVKVTSESGVKVNANKPVRVKETILCYSKSDNWKYNKQFVIDGRYDPNYSYYVENPRNKASNWRVKRIKDKYFEVYNAKPSNQDLYNFQVKFKNNVFSVRDISNKLKNKYFSNNKNRFVLLKNDKKTTILWKNGEVVFFANKVRNIGGIEISIKHLSDIWIDISWDGIANEGGVILKKGKKPEKLLARIINMSTMPGDIIVDFFLATGTTCAVAHKMKRQYIGIEQLNYKENDSVQRLKNVIGGDQTGISKSVNWKGGGDFIYCELMKYNELFIEKIQKAKDTKTLLKIWEEMKNKSFLNYNIDIKKFDEVLDEFKKLPLAKQKHTLFDLLNKNQLYVNLSEIKDKEYTVNKEDEKLNREFYGRQLNI